MFYLQFWIFRFQLDICFYFSCIFWVFCDGFKEKKRKYENLKKKKINKNLEFFLIDFRNIEYIKEVQKIVIYKIYGVVGDYIEVYEIKILYNYRIVNFEEEGKKKKFQGEVIIFFFRRLELRIVFNLF